MEAQGVREKTSFDDQWNFNTHTRLKRKKEIQEIQTFLYSGIIAERSRVSISDI